MGKLPFSHTSFSASRPTNNFHKSYIHLYIFCEMPVESVEFLHIDNIMSSSGVDPAKDFVKCPVKAGSVIFFSNLTPHRRYVILSRLRKHAHAIYRDF